MVVVSSTPEIAPPATGCAYQIKVGDSPLTYKCYTADEYQTYQAQRAKEQEASNEWLNSHWWIAAILGVFILLFLFFNSKNGYI